MRMLPILLADLRFSFRSLARKPGILLPAVLCLALGLGANATMLGLLDRLLLRAPAQVQDAAALRRLFRLRVPPAGQSFRQAGFSYPMYSDLLGRVPAISGIAGFDRREAALGAGESSQKVRCVLVTPSFFEVLGVRPARGRPFAEGEGSPVRRGAVALLSWEYWQRAFQGASDILGKELTLPGGPYTVIGVMPPRFTGIDLDPVDVWLPIGAEGELTGRPGWWQDRPWDVLHVVVRLRPEATAAQAAAQATVVERRVCAALQLECTVDSVVLGLVQPGHDPEDRRPALFAAWLGATSGAVLLIACFNVAGLLLARGLERRRELAIRMALGSSRGGLARLLLTEGFLLAGLGGLAAYGVALLGSLVVQSLILPGGAVPPGGLDIRLLAILAGLSLAAGLLCGLAPALRGLSGGPAEMLKREGGIRRRSPAAAALLIAQVAFTFGLLAEAGLFLLSLWHARHVQLGFDAGRVLVATFERQDLVANGVAVEPFLRRALDRLRHLPGVELGSMGINVPFATHYGVSLKVSGHDRPGRLAPGGIYLNAVAGDFLTTTGTRLLAGRTLSEAEPGGERVAVVNATMARLLWPGRNPLGQCFTIGDEETDPCTITVVGVAEDAHWLGLEEPPSMQFYVPLAQAPVALSARRAPSLFVRVTEPGRFRGVVRRELQALSPRLPFVEVRPLEEVLAPRLRLWRTAAILLSLFGLLALTLAVVGIAGIVRQGVAARTRELGVRAALGAGALDLMWLVQRNGLGIAAAGTVAGYLLAALAGRWLGPLLFGVSAEDAGVTAAASVLLLATVLVAGWLPARRVRKLAPANALRAD